MERDYGTVAQLLRAMPIGDGGVTGYKVWIIFHQSGMAGNRETDRRMQKVWRCSDGYQGQEMVARPAVGSKTLVDLKWLWSSQGLHSLSQFIGTKATTVLVEGAGSGCSSLPALWLWQTVEVLLKGSSRRMYGQAERCDELPFSQVTPI